MKILSTIQNFQWVGNGVPIQKRGKKIRYEAFIFGDLKIKIGDFVLVRNDDALDPEDCMSCYVAQVKNLFDTGDELDPYQAQVQWFSRVLELPTYAIKLFKNVGHELEVVKDKRSSWHDTIDAETIFQKCAVLFLPSDCDFESALSDHKNYSELTTPVFFCRYVFTGTSLIEVKVHPAKISSANENSSMNGSVSHSEKTVVNNIMNIKSKSPSKTCERYCANLVGSPTKIPRVVIKKIDDKILESRNRNVRIFVANSNVENIEDVANTFLNKLKLEKQEEEKKPVIHALTTQNGSLDGEPAADTDLMDYDSNVESETSKTPQKLRDKMHSIKLNAKFCKNVFAYNTRNSPKKDISLKSDNLYTISKKPKIAMIDEVKLEPSNLNERYFSDKDISKCRVGKNTNLGELCVDTSGKKKLKNGDECETNGHLNKNVTKIDSASIAFRTKKIFTDKRTISPANKSARKITMNNKKTSPNKLTELEVSDIYSTPKKKASNFIKNSLQKFTEIEDSESYTSPKKKTKFADELEEFRLTRSGRRVKAVDYTEGKSETNLISAVTPTKKLPRYICNNYSDDSESDNFKAYFHSSDNDDDSSSDLSLLDETSPDKKKHSWKTKATCKKSKSSLNVRMPKSRKNLINLSIPERKTPLKTPKNALEESRLRLHVSSVPTSLPCRDEEYSDIYSFVKGCLCAQTGGCMYISGVPGTGKTATVHEVIRNLEEEKELGEVPIFTFVEVNGMWMTDPYQCYAQIFKALTGKNIAPQQAADLLEKRFTERGPKKDAVVLLVDELDRLWTRKQTVMYNIFDWPTKMNSKLIVLAIANTMDLPERMMMNRISSRLGLTRKTFQPYTFKQLQEIIMSRIQELKVFDPDAVQLVARKVAAVSGDARRALDICRFATETVKVGQTAKKSQKILIGMEHVDKALQQMFSSPVISAIRSSSKIAKLFFQCMLSEFTCTGLEETTLLKVHRQVISTCRFEGLNPPNSTEISRICADLAASHLILVDNFKNDLYMKIRLNISSDDVTYALTLK